MDITVSLPFLQFSASSGAGNYFVFMAFALVWIVGIFAYAGLTSTLGKVFSVLT